MARRGTAHPPAEVATPSVGTEREYQSRTTFSLCLSSTHHCQRVELWKPPAARYLSRRAAGTAHPRTWSLWSLPATAAGSQPVHHDAGRQIRGSWGRLRRRRCCCHRDGEAAGKTPPVSSWALTAPSNELTRMPSPSRRAAAAAGTAPRGPASSLQWARPWRGAVSRTSNCRSRTDSSCQLK